MTPILEDFVQHIRADNAALAALSEALSEWTIRAALPQRIAFHLSLILDELLTNVVEHGVPLAETGHGDNAYDKNNENEALHENHEATDGHEDTSGRDIRIEVRVSLVNGGNALEVHVRDDAQPFNPFSAHDPGTGATLCAPLEARAPGGLGIHFVKRLTQVFEYKRHAALHSEGHAAAPPEPHLYAGGSNDGARVSDAIAKQGYNEIRLLIHTGYDA